MIATVPERDFPDKEKEATLHTLKPLKQQFEVNLPSPVNKPFSAEQLSSTEACSCPQTPTSVFEAFRDQHGETLNDSDTEWSSTGTDPSINSKAIPYEWVEHDPNDQGTTTESMLRMKDSALIDRICQNPIYEIEIGGSSSFSPKSQVYLSTGLDTMDLQSTPVLNQPSPPTASPNQLPPVLSPMIYTPNPPNSLEFESGDVPHFLIGEDRSTQHIIALPYTDTRKDQALTRQMKENISRSIQPAETIISPPSSASPLSVPTLSNITPNPQYSELLGCDDALKSVNEEGRNLNTPRTRDRSATTPNLQYSGDLRTKTALQLINGSTPPLPPPLALPTHFPDSHSLGEQSTLVRAKHVQPNRVFDSSGIHSNDEPYSSFSDSSSSSHSEIDSSTTTNAQIPTTASLEISLNTASAEEDVISTKSSTFTHAPETLSDHGVSDNEFAEEDILSIPSTPSPHVPISPPAIVDTSVESENDPPFLSARPLDDIGEQPATDDWNQIDLFELYGSVDNSEDMDDTS
ncbi:hypothetical protein BLNAU_21207 [Blattamonas nauphoetae]|uniref:Uncharacterized protein n=1 Tax=Blattamonas nauphoetae TaxID=2049346 RepID=A0ABQ9WWK5_9EUKA|nr:hypothetical protein BLNAU_21207 [Blattamonas nauphoetae]